MAHTAGMCPSFLRWSLPSQCLEETFCDRTFDATWVDVIAEVAFDVFCCEDLTTFHVFICALLAILG